MYTYILPQWVFIFYLYCFLGWCFESLVVSVTEKKWVNRGFMRGPFLPLYGSGGIMMLLVSMPFQDNILLVYVAGCIGATALEFVTGVVMEALFKVRYWDYSDKKFQFKGYICLGSTLAWGLLTILMTEVIHKWIEGFVLAIPINWLTAITLILTALIFSDFALSFRAALDLRDILVKLDQAKKEMVLMQKRLDVIIALTNEELSNRKDEFNSRKDEFTEKISEGIETRIEDLVNSIEDKLESIKNLAKGKSASDYPDGVKEELWDIRKRFSKSEADRDRVGRLKEFYQKRILRSNPTMSSSKFKEALDELKKKAQKNEED